MAKYLPRRLRAAVRRVVAVHDCRPDRISQDQFREHFVSLIDSHFWSTVNSDRAGLAFFFNHVLCTDWNWGDIVKPRKVKSLADVITYAQVAALINATREQRYEAFFLCTYSIGLRLGEALSLEVQDIDAAQEHPRAPGQGQEESLRPPPKAHARQPAPLLDHPSASDVTVPCWFECPRTLPCDQTDEQERRAVFDQVHCPRCWHSHPCFTAHPASRLVLVGFASYLTPESHLVGTERTIHHVEIYLGILIGALTFAGSVVAFGKLSGKIGSRSLILPNRHMLNVGIGVACLLLMFIGAAPETLQKPTAKVTGLSC